MTEPTNDEARYYARADALSAGARVTPAARPRLSGHVPVRFPVSTIDLIKRFSIEDGVTVSTWVRRTVDKAIAMRATATTTSRRADNFFFKPEQPEDDRTVSASRPQMQYA